MRKSIVLALLLTVMLFSSGCIECIAGLLLFADSEAGVEHTGSQPKLIKKGKVLEVKETLHETSNADKNG